jgi:hypothetical protein
LDFGLSATKFCFSFFVTHLQFIRSFFSLFFKTYRKMKKLLLLGLGIALSGVMLSPAHALVNNVRCWEDGTGNSCAPLTNWRSVSSKAVRARMANDKGVTPVHQFVDKLQNQNTTYLGYKYDDVRAFMNGARDEAYSDSEYNVTGDSRQRKLFPLREARAARNKAVYPIYETASHWWDLY